MAGSCQTVTLSITAGPMLSEIITSVPTRQETGLLDSFWYLVRVTSSCGPNWVGFCQAHKLRVEIFQRWEQRRLAPQLDFPVVQHFHFHLLLERLFTWLLFQNNKRVRQRVHQANIADKEEPGLGRRLSRSQNILSLQLQWVTIPNKLRILKWISAVPWRAPPRK